jgi:hypothetical protein
MLKEEPESERSNATAVYNDMSRGSRRDLEG